MKDVNKRFHPNETLFSTPEVSLYADLVHHFETNPELCTPKKGNEIEMACNLEITYKHLHQDVRAAVDWIHQQGLLKKTTVEVGATVVAVVRTCQTNVVFCCHQNLEKYVARNPERLSGLLRRMRERCVVCVRARVSGDLIGWHRGAKLFLLTNSEYYYTDAVMTFLLSGADAK
jgi:5'-nucleotidase